VSERPPARFQEFRAEFRELFSDWAWTPPVDFPLVSKSIVKPALSRIPSTVIDDNFLPAPDAAKTIIAVLHGLVA
jgi:hypothetical protein